VARLAGNGCRGDAGRLFELRPPVPAGLSERGRTSLRTASQTRAGPTSPTTASTADNRSHLRMRHEVDQLLDPNLGMSAWPLFEKEKRDCPCCYLGKGRRKRRVLPASSSSPMCSDTHRKNRRLKGGQGGWTLPQHDRPGTLARAYPRGRLGAIPGKGQRLGRTSNGNHA
jgi:hypothetical protein